MGTCGQKGRYLLWITRGARGTVHADERPSARRVYLSSRMHRLAGHGVAESCKLLRMLDAIRPVRCRHAGPAAAVRGRLCAANVHGLSRASFPPRAARIFALLASPRSPSMLKPIAAFRKPIVITPAPSSSRARPWGGGAHITCCRLFATVGMSEFFACNRGAHPLTESETTNLRPRPSTHSVPDRVKISMYVSSARRRPFPPRGVVATWTWDPYVTRQGTTALWI